MNPGMKSLAFATFALGAIALGVLELPIDDFAKLGISGMAMGLLWWLIARTIPGMVASHSGNLEHLTAAYREAIADLRTLHHETTSQLGEHLDGVKEVIREAAQSEASLLRELIREKKT